MIKFAEETREISLKATPIIAFLRPWLLVAVLALVASCTYPFTGGAGRDFSVAIFVSSMLSMASLLGMQLGIANKWWRFLIAPFAIVVPAAIIGASTGPTIEWVEATISGSTTVIVFLTLEITKLFFGHFRIAGKDELMDDGLQFGIAQLMIATAAVAVFISLVKFLLGFVGASNSGFSNTYLIYLAATFVSSLVVFTLANVWAMMGSVVRNRLFVSIAAALVAIAPLFFLASDISDLVLWASILGICWVTIALQLLLLRRSGLRFVRR